MVLPHKKLVQYLKSYGMTHSNLDNGVCYGFSAQAVFAILLNDFAKFKNRIRLLSDTKPDDMNQKIAQVRNQHQRKRLEMTKEQEEIEELPAFFENIVINHCGNAYLQFFLPGKKIFSQSLMLTAPFTLPVLLEKEGGIVAHDFFTHVYSKTDLTHFLTDLSHAVTNENGPHFIAGILMHGTHAITIGLDRNTKQWYFIDTEQLNAENLEVIHSAEQLSTFIFNALKANEKVVMTMQFFAKKSEEKIFKQMIEQLKKQTSSPMRQTWTIENVQFSNDENGVTALYLAAQQGQAKVVERLLNAGASPNQAMKEGMTPLYVAAQNAHLVVVQVLISANAAIDHNLYCCQNPLLIAVKQGHLAVVEQFIAAGALNNWSTNWSENPLLIAAQEGHLDVVEVLVKAEGIPVDQATSEEGATPLYIAALMGHSEVVAALIKAGALIDQPTNDGRTPLFVAAEDGYLAIVAMLIAAGAKVNDALENGATPLFIAAQNGQVEVVKVLLQEMYEQDASVISFKNTKGFLRTFAEAFNVQVRMNEVLNQKTENESGLVAISPYEIAMIMNHENIAKLIQAFELGSVYLSPRLSQ